MMDYQQFLESKIRIADRLGFDVDESEINDSLKPHQKAAVKWALAGGCRALFEAFGLGKSIQQLEIVRLAIEKMEEADDSSDYTRRRGLIVCPLGVRQEFVRDSHDILGWAEPPAFIRATSEIFNAPSRIYLTNYESLREKKIDLALFHVISLDEASILRSFGSKTFSEFLFGDVQKVRYRYVATATPSPNEYQELLAYAHFLGVMDIGQARTRFFKRNSEKSDDLTLHVHKEEEFWLWVASWALFLQRPSDLGFSDEGYDLPELNVRFHEIPVDHLKAAPDKFGQGQLMRSAKAGLSDAAREKRDSLDDRIAKAAEIVSTAPDDHFIVWHDLEDERKAIEKALPDARSVYGSQDLDLREDLIIGFSNGDYKLLAGKPQMLGSGCNFQRHCHRAIYAGIGFKFNDFIQSIHRLLRFLQDHEVIIDIIYAESEKPILENLLDKWERDKEQRRVMTEIIRKYGLSHEALNAQVTRSLGVERTEAAGAGWTCINNDSVLECRSMAESSVGMILTSIPFSTQYEYTPSYNDFGHTDDNEHFFDQMDYLTPELFRLLQPGRVAAVHVKDRVVPSQMTNNGCMEVYEFHADVIKHFRKHGFAFLGMKTIVTDVVRENNQTYRLSYSEQCKDGSKMGVGMPEYLLLFRRPPSETQNLYADTPVVKSKADYSLGRWQIDAHGFARSSGDRLLESDEFQDLRWHQIYRIFRSYSKSTVYDFLKHVDLCEKLDAAGRLPRDFMLLPPQSNHPDVWTDITRMRTLNSSQSQRSQVKHICPLQFDIVDRAINQHSMPGEIILDPFGGIGTVAYRAVALGRKAISIELNPGYHLDAVSYCQAAEMKASMPTLFDLIEEPETELVEEAMEVAA